VSSKDKLLVLDWVFIPQFRRLPIERRGTGTISLRSRLRVSDLLVGPSQETLKTEEHTLNVVYSTPFVLENVQADSSREIDIRMIYGSLEEDRRWSIRIVGGESKRQLEGEPIVIRLFRSTDGASPVEEVAI
jgi:hypothetical protein